MGEDALSPRVGIGQPLPDPLAQLSVGLENAPPQQRGVRGGSRSREIQELLEGAQLGAQPPLFLRHLALEHAENIDRDQRSVLQARIGEARKNLLLEQVTDRLEQLERRRSVLHGSEDLQRIAAKT